MKVICRAVIIVIKCPLIDYLCTGSQERPYLKILEEPVPKFRFRYRSEMRGAHGSLLGRSETSRKRSHPTVEVCAIILLCTSVCLWSKKVFYR